jgi:L-amino acid N-acyltransferase YncA
MATPADAPAVAAIYEPFCTSTAVSFETQAPTAATMAERIRRITEQYPWLVMEEDGAVCGYAYASRHRERAAYQWSAEVTVYVATSHQRSGVGRSLYSRLFELLVEQGYFKAFAGITLPNPGSVRLHETIGFLPIGVFQGIGYKLGAWHDVAWYQKQLRPEQPDPPPPIPITGLSWRTTS